MGQLPINLNLHVSYRFIQVLDSGRHRLRTGYTLLLLAFVIMLVSAYPLLTQAEAPPACETELSQIESLCSVNPAELQDWTRHPKGLVIDMRSPAQFQRLSIENSIRLAPFAIQAQKHMKTRELLLIDEPHAFRSLYESCAALGKLGFKKVSILPGGIPAWKMAGGNLKGDMTSLQMIPTINSQELVRELHFRPWLLINTAPAEDSIPAIADTDIIRLEISADKSLFLEKLKELVRSRRAVDRNLPICIFGRGDSLNKEQALATLLSELSKTKFLYLLNGGELALLSFMKQHQDMLLALEERAKVRGCGL